MHVSRICWVLVAVLGISTGVMAYKFILSGSVKTSADGRLAIQLTPGERDLVLGEMRTFLNSVQLITQGIADRNFDVITKAADDVGLAAQQEVPGTLVGKLPLEFKKLGFDTHERFTQLSLDAKQLQDEAHTLEQLSTLLNNCVACHAAFKFEATEKQ
jgi:hypothetical protein